MKTATQKTTWNQIALFTIAGAAAGIGIDANAQISEDLVITQIESGSYRSVSPSENVTLYGVLRDFSATHPDFGLATGVADGQYTGNVSFFADADHKPVYVGTGSEVSTQWLNKNNQPIAPHLYNFSGYNAWPQGSGVYSTGTIFLGQGTLIDAWDSSMGTYEETKSSDGIVALQSTDSGAITLYQDGTIDSNVLIGTGGDSTLVVDDSTRTTGGITGTTGTLATAPDPLPVLPPADIGASVGNLTWTTDITVSSDIHADALNIGSGAVVTIDGDISIVCDGRLTLGDLSRIELTAGSSLDIYTLSDVQAVSQAAQVNANTKDPSLVTFYHLSGTPFVVSQQTVVWGTIYAPGAEVRISQSAKVYGRVLAARVELKQGATMHIDKKLAAPQTVCGAAISDTPGAYVGPHDGAVRDMLSFRHWFRNVPGVNATDVARISMVNNGSGVYEHTTDDFTIADGQLLGNQGDMHNRYFTYELTAVGQYNMCAGQFFEFAGDGDVWVMINDQLVIDLGGQGTGKFQVAELDRMNMSEGELFTFRFYYAQRTDGASPFSIRTNINFVFSDAAIPDSSGLYD